MRVRSPSIVVVVFLVGWPLLAGAQRPEPRGVTGFTTSAASTIPPRLSRTPVGASDVSRARRAGPVVVGGVLGAALGAVAIGGLSYWVHQESCESVNCREQGWRRGVRTAAITGGVVGGVAGVLIAW